MQRLNLNIYNKGQRTNINNRKKIDNITVRMIFCHCEKLINNEKNYSEVKDSVNIDLNIVNYCPNFAGVRIQDQ